MPEEYKNFDDAFKTGDETEYKKDNDWKKFYKQQTEA